MGAGVRFTRMLRCSSSNTCAAVDWHAWRSSAKTATARSRSSVKLRVLLSHDPEIVLGVLVEIFSLDDIAAPRGILRHHSVTLVVATRILHAVARVARPDACRMVVGCPGAGLAGARRYCCDMDGTASYVDPGPRTISDVAGRAAAQLLSKTRKGQFCAATNCAPQRKSTCEPAASTKKRPGFRRPMRARPEHKKGPLL